MPRIKSFQPRCFAFLKTHPERLCACAGKYVVDGVRYCGTHKKIAEKAATAAGMAHVAEIARQHQEKPECGLCEDACPICYDSITSIGAQMTLECGHAFHKECAATWVSTKESCPMCRAVVHVPPPQNYDVMGEVTKILTCQVDARIAVRFEATVRQSLVRMKAALLAGKDCTDELRAAVQAIREVSEAHASAASEASG